MRFVDIRWNGEFAIGRKQSYAGIIVLLLAGCSAAANTNEWTKTTSGNWEEPYWSLGHLPGMDQEWVAFRNPGWKALAIGPTTTANYPQSLSLNSLVVEAPTNSFNQLLLNWAGMSVPLAIHSNLMIGTNGSLDSHYSALQAANADIAGSASFSDNSAEEFGQLSLWPGGTLNLTNGTMACSNLTLLNATYQQSGGTAYISANSHANLPLNESYSVNSFYLEDGTLISGGLEIGLSYWKSSGAYDTFYQSGGVHSNSLMYLRGWIDCCPEPFSLGYYRLSGGMLASDEVNITSGSFEQTGGTNRIELLSLSEGGYFSLVGGELATSNVLLQETVPSSFNQTGGVHTVRNRLLLGANYGGYSLNGGILNAANIEVGPEASLELLGGAVSNSGLFTLRADGKVDAGNITNTQLGQLQITNDNSMQTASLRMNAGPTVLHFQDSRTISWSGLLQILSWHAASDRIFIGTNSQALTAEQLNAITFVNPVGWPSGNYPATLLPSGELAPAGAQQADGYTFITTNGAAIITGYTGNDPAITIPGTIGGFPVIAIGDNAFSGANALTNVTIDSGIKIIGSSAFESCSNLTSVTIPNSVTNVGDSAFSYCTSLTSVIIPSSVTTLGTYAFEGCNLLSAVYFAGNAPNNGYSLGYPYPTVYYLPGTSGWGPTFAGDPTALWLPKVETNPLTFGFRSNQFSFSVAWASGRTVVIEACTNLANRTWISIATNSLTNGRSYFSDPEWTNQPARFYRPRPQ